MNAHSHVVGGGAFLTGSESSSECARGVSLHRIDNSHSTLLSRVIGLLNVFYASTEVLLKQIMSGSISTIVGALQGTCHMAEIKDLFTTTRSDNNDLSRS